MAKLSKKKLKTKEPKTIKDKAIYVLEAFCLPDFKIKNFKDTVYKYCHIARNPKCIKSHDAWIDDLEKDYKFVKKAGF